MSNQQIERHSMRSSTVLILIKCTPEQKLRKSRGPFLKQVNFNLEEKAKILAVFCFKIVSMVKKLQTP